VTAEKIFRLSRRGSDGCAATWHCLDDDVPRERSASAAQTGGDGFRRCAPRRPSRGAFFVVRVELLRSATILLVQGGWRHSGAGMTSTTMVSTYWSTNNWAISRLDHFFYFGHVILLRDSSRFPARMLTFRGPGIAQWPGAISSKPSISGPMGHLKHLRTETSAHSIAEKADVQFSVVICSRTRFAALNYSANHPRDRRKTWF